MAERDPRIDPIPSSDSGGRPPVDDPQRAMDTAGQSLAEALHVSFRLLTVLMLLVVVLFLASGFTSINENERGVLKVFGAIVGQVEPGLAYNWPFPVGEIQRVPTEVRTLEVNDFWFHIQPSEAGKAPSEVRPLGEGVRPGMDGALLSGDRYLCHVRLTILYAVRDAAEHVTNVRDAEEIIRSLVCQAAIRSAAARTAEAVLKEQGSFVNQIREEVNRRLSQLEVGMVLTSVRVANFSWPLRAVADYEEASNITTEMEQRRNIARSEAEKTLAGAAGQRGFRLLVGEPWRESVRDLAPMAGLPAGPEGLIGRYELAREDGNMASAEAILAQIDQALVSDIAEGQASATIEEARRYKASIQEGLSARAQEFEDALPEYEATPELFVLSRWLEARGEIEQSPTIYKRYLTLDPEGKAVLYLPKSAEVIKKIRAARLRKRKDEAEQARQADRMPAPLPPSDME
jgi:membrane protease subunit HflK